MVKAKEALDKAHAEELYAARWTHAEELQSLKAELDRAHQKKARTAEKFYVRGFLDSEHDNVPKFKIPNY